MRARRTASFDRPYSYPGQTYPAMPIPALVRAVAARASELAGYPFDHCLCNRYESGDRTTGFHSDSYAELVPDSLIAIATFDSARALVLLAFDRAHRTTYLLERGSILPIGSRDQEAWQHAVPRMPQAGRRISLTFRRFRSDAGA